MKACLVFGSGGLIGRAVVDTLEKTHFGQIIYTPRITWASEPTAQAEIGRAVHEWLAQSQCEGWELYWCAGAGSPRSGVAANEQERSLYRTVLHQIEQAVQTNQAQRITIFFSSSAGGVYGSTGQTIATELSVPQPTDDYGKSKFELERVTTEFSQRTGIGSVIGRISSVFGEHQDLQKRLGLITHLAFSIAARKPISIFTNLATTRNYIAAVTAGAVIVHYVRCSKGSESILRNVCAPYDTSVAELLTLTKQVTGHRVEIAYSGAAEMDNSRISTNFADEICHLTRSSLPAEFARLINLFRISVAQYGELQI